MTNETQPRRSILRSISRLIPGWGFYDYMHSGDANRDKDSSAKMKSMLHFANMLAGGIFLMAYVANAPVLGANPLKWRNEERRRISEQYQSQQIATQKTYDGLCDQLFGTNGLADVNQNGTIEPKELLDAFNRCGMLRLPTERDLRRGIDSYKNKGED